MVARRRPVCVGREATIAEASRLMREERVDAVVVTDRLDGKPIPAGIVSARDVVTRVVAVGLDPAVITAGDVLSMDDLLQALPVSIELRRPKVQ